MSTIYYKFVGLNNISIPINSDSKFDFLYECRKLAEQHGYEIVFLDDEQKEKLGYYALFVNDKQSIMGLKCFHADAPIATTFFLIHSKDCPEINEGLLSYEDCVRSLTSQGFVEIPDTKWGDTMAAFYNPSNDCIAKVEKREKMLRWRHV